MHVHTKLTNSLNPGLHVLSVYAYVYVHVLNVGSHKPVRNAQSLHTAIDREGVGYMAVVEPVARGTHL